MYTGTSDIIYMHILLGYRPMYLKKVTKLIFSLRYLVKLHMKPFKKLKKHWEELTKTISGKSLHLHGSLLPFQIQSLCANQKVIIQNSTIQSMVTGIGSRKKNYQSYTQSQLYTEIMRVKWLVKGKLQMLPLASRATAY